MKHYYFAENGQQLGPFTIEELKDKKIKKTTLVWTDSLADWTVAENVDEIKDFLIAVPPPLPDSAKAKVNETGNYNGHSAAKIKYDNSYEKETEATVVGILLFIVPLAMHLSGIIKFQSEAELQTAKIVSLILSLLLRFFATVWVREIAKRQNRNENGWGWLAFFLPSISLIIIGQLRKLNLTIEIDTNQEPTKQISNLLQTARSLYEDNRYAECIKVLDAILLKDIQNYEALKLRGICLYTKEEFGKAQKDFIILYSNNQYASVVGYYLGNLELKNKNIEKAVEYWEFGGSAGNSLIKTKLDIYKNYKGKYVLEGFEVENKLGASAGVTYFYNVSAQYLSGMPEIDKIQKLDKFKTGFFTYEYGLGIELTKFFTTYRIGISYHEIENIVFNYSQGKFEIYLFDGKTVFFYSSDREKCLTGLKLVCDKIEKITGKKIMLEPSPVA